MKLWRRGERTARKRCGGSSRPLLSAASLALVCWLLSLGPTSHDRIRSNPLSTGPGEGPQVGFQSHSFPQPGTQNNHTGCPCFGVSRVLVRGKPPPRALREGRNLRKGSLGSHHIFWATSENQLQRPVPSLTSAVTLDKLFNLSVP